MNKSNIYLSAEEQRLTKKNGKTYVSDTVGYIVAHFQLDDEWKEFDSVRAVWKNKYELPIPTVLDFDGTCEVPAELLTRVGNIEVNLIGSNVVDDIVIDRLTTHPVIALSVVTKARTDLHETKITPSEFEQYVNQVKDFWSDIPIVADGLPAGSDPTALFNTDTHTLELGIPKGDTGDSAGFGTVTATVDANHGTPSVTVTTSGEDTAKNFAFAFSNLQPAPYDDSELQTDFATLQAQFDTAVAAVTVDSEVADVRVGADGTTYNSAGAAVRGQVSDLKQESTRINLDTINASLPIVLATDWEKGGLDSTTGAETSTNILIRTGFYAISDECELIFSGVTTNRAMFNYFYDANKSYIGRRNNGTTVGVPTGAKFVRFCYGFLQSSGITVDGYGMNNLIADWSMSIKSPLQQSAETAEHTALGTLDANTPIVLAKDWEIGGLDGTTGLPIPTDILIRTGFFPISDECEYEFTGVFTDQRICYSYFYDENKNYISRSSTDIPTGARFVRFTYGFRQASGITVSSYGMANTIADWGVSITSPINKFIKTSDIAVNQIKYADLLTGYALNVRGETFERSDFTTVDYIDVSDSTALYLNYGARYAFYDSDKVMVSTGNVIYDSPLIKGIKVLYVPDNATYFRICILNTDVPTAYIYKSTKEVMAMYKTFLSKDCPSEVFNIDLSAEENYGDVDEYDATNITSDGYTCPTGWENHIRINKCVVSDYIAYRAHIKLGTAGAGQCVLGTIDAGHTASVHATIVVFDFTNGVVEFRTGASGNGANIDGTAIPTYVYSSFPLTNLSGTEYRIEIGRENRCVYAKVYNLTTGKLCGEDTLEVYETSSSYGAKAGALYDNPTFGVIDGTISFKRVSASVPTDVFAAFVGDSITEGSQLAITDVWANKAITYLGSGVNLGRGGGNIDNAIDCARDILPAMKPKYVIITIGTNGGNTSDKLDKLINLVKAVGAIPILNCIPMKSTSVADINNTILAKDTDHVRFDVATAINNDISDGQNTDLFFSDVTHPNADGGAKMYEQFVATVGWIKQ